jgi:kynurenine 3-monooxygenase
MLIALPNQDKSFSITLSMPFEGKTSFANLQTKKQIYAFFTNEFKDAVEAMPNLIEEYTETPTNSLVTIKSSPWVKNNVFVVGDAAHAVVPFYGQGMICGFEDCYVLDNLLNKYADNWQLALEAFNKERKPDADAIAELALENFMVSQDTTTNNELAIRKQMDRYLNKLYPDIWIPLYDMVTFNPDIRYSKALEISKKQNRLLDEVIKSLTPGQDWHTLDFEIIIAQL